MHATSHHPGPEVSGATCRAAGKGEEKTNASTDDVSNRRPAENVPAHGSASQRTGGGSARISARPVEVEAGKDGSG